MLEIKVFSSFYTTVLNFLFVLYLYNTTVNHVQLVEHRNCASRTVMTASVRLKGQGIAR